MSWNAIEMHLSVEIFAHIDLPYEGLPCDMVGVDVNDLSVLAVDDQPSRASCYLERCLHVFVSQNTIATNAYLRHSTASTDQRIAYWTRLFFCKLLDSAKDELRRSLRDGAHEVDAIWAEALELNVTLKTYSEVECHIRGALQELFVKLLSSTYRQQPDWLIADAQDADSQLVKCQQS